MQTAKEFIHNLPEIVDKDALVDKETRFHFLISGEAAGEYTVEIKDGQVAVSDGIHGVPKCTVKANNDSFMKVVRGELNPMMAILTGKIKISNQGEMIKYAKIFGLMK